VFIYLLFVSSNNCDRIHRPFSERDLTTMSWQICSIVDINRCFDQQKRH